jgi:hypothetical protein
MKNLLMLAFSLFMLSGLDRPNIETVQELAPKPPKTT